MKTENYKKSFLLFTHIILGAILAIFTLLWTFDYTKNLLIGYIISGAVLLVYFFILKKSVSLYYGGRIGASYFLTISGFVALAFIEMINCSNSINWH